MDSDSIQDQLVGLLDGKIGKKLTRKDSAQIQAGGKERYQAKVPPGYHDAAKPEGDERYGDLIVWYQILGKAITAEKGITFLTSDRKDDWWRKFGETLVGPRPELVAEMRDKSNADFEMYEPDSFMDIGGKMLGAEVEEEAIKEVRQIQVVARATRGDAAKRYWELIQTFSSDAAQRLIREQVERSLAAQRIVDEQLKFAANPALQR